jgi:HK97 family phage major capsid protein
MARKLDRKHENKTIYAADFSGTIKGVDSGNRTLTLVATDESRDRDGDIISIKGWRLENYLKNPVVLFAHKYDEPAIAGCVKIVKARDQLILTHKFPKKGVYPKADIVFGLYAEKIMKASSVGFIPHTWEEIKDEDNRTLLGRRFTSQELLEHSLVSVPANPNALLLNAAKTLTGRSREELRRQLRTPAERPDEKCNDAISAILAGGCEYQEETRTKQVQVPRNFKSQNIEGVKRMNIEQLKKKKMQLLESLYDAQGEEADAIRREIKQVNDEIKLKVQKQFPLEAGTSGKAVEPESDAIYFRDKDGQEHKAISLKEKYADLVGAKTFEDRVSAGNIIRANILGSQGDLNKSERDLLLKAQQEGTGSLGGFLLPEPASSQIIDLARNKMQVMRAGARTMKMDSATLTLVKILTDPTAYWRAESAAITESDGTFEPINLKAMVVGALIRVSMELLQDAPNVASTLEQMMASALALEQDRVALLGTGVDEPMGLDAASGVEVISMGANGAAPTDYDEFSQAVQKVAENNGEAKAVIYAPRTFFTLDRLKEGTTNAPLRGPDSYENLKKLVTNQIPITDTKGSATTCSKAYVGDFSNLLFAIRKDVTVDASKAGGGSSGNDAFAQMEVLIRAFLRMDIAIIRENHFCKIEGIKAS